MTEHEPLKRYLKNWAARDEMREAVAVTLLALAESCCAIAEIIALGPLAGRLGARHGQNVDGDTQLELDIRANELVIEELLNAPVAYLASEETGPALTHEPGRASLRGDRSTGRVIEYRHQRLRRHDFFDHANEM